MSNSLNVPSSIIIIVSSSTCVHTMWTVVKVDVVFGRSSDMFYQLLVQRLV